MKYFLIVAFLFPLFFAPAAQSQDVVRTAIEKAIPHLDKAGQEWIDHRKCITCHRISFMTWGFREASRRGFAIDGDRLQERLTWSFDTTISPDKSKPDACNKNPDGIGQLLIGHSAPPFALTPEQSEKFVAALIKVQKGDGSWAPQGQLPGQKRPLEETTQVSTMWNLIGLGHAVATEPIQKSREKGLGWLTTAKPGVSTEWYAAQLVLQVQEKKEEKVAELIKELKALQHDDGGFGWLTADPSDALGTGQALYALFVAGVKADDPAVTKSIQFLTTTQQENGSWAVKGTKANRKDKIEETATYWGTAWAVIALLQTQPIKIVEAAQ